MSPKKDQPTPPRYGDRRRVWKEAFVDYMTFIVDHPNYAGMPCTRDGEGKIDWIIPTNRPRGSKNWDGNARRKAWWVKRAKELKIPLTGHWISKVAKRIHPIGKKPCQTCGRVMEIGYAYPTPRTIAALNRFLPKDEQLSFGDLLLIDEVIDHLYDSQGASQAAPRLGTVFPGVPSHATAQQAKKFVRANFVQTESRKLSPGAMSNPPDRLDGFHTYNLCCRGTEDRARSVKNLRTYADDRRAFEQWCEGNWAAANLLMTLVVGGACQNLERCPHSASNQSLAVPTDLTADHVGPISLGFRHTPDFMAVCQPCNSGKNNRMSHADVTYLIQREKRVGPVVSWQVRALWDACKHQVGDRHGALLLSKLMRIAQHHYLGALHDALEAGLPHVLLIFLEPEWALNKYEFNGLERATLKYDRLDVRKRNTTYYHSKAARMVRIAFESLRDYHGKEKRNVQLVSDELVASAKAQYAVALHRAQQEPSALKHGLVKILGLDINSEERARELARLFNGVYKPDSQYKYVRTALERLMAAYADVLVMRFKRGEAVNWGDFD